MNIFNAIPLWKPKRHTFNLGFENKLTTDMFRLTPFVCKEALPDDVWKIRPEIFARVSPMLAPVMHRFNIRAYYFFVPNRIIWDDFEKWINPKSGQSDITAPRFAFSGRGFGNLAPKSLADYLGVNLGISPEGQSSFSNFLANAERVFPSGELEVSALPFRAYQQVYNDWFIDLNNVDKSDFSKGSGVVEIETIGDADADVRDNLSLRYRAWEHDYLTSAMPSPQRGPDVLAFPGISGDDVQIEGVAGGTLDPSTFHIPATNLEVVSITYNNVRYTNLDALVADYQNFGYSNLESFVNANGFVLDNDNHYHFGDGVYSSPSGIAGAVEVERLGNDPEFGINICTYNSGNKIAKAKLEVRSAGATVVGPTASLFTIPSSDVARILKVKVNSDGNAGAVTVEELRTRMQMQQFLERNEIGGSRYTEMLYAHWGVKDPDGRLQRSEFIGGWKQPIMINDVSQTSAPTDDDPLGQWAGQGISSSLGKTIKFHVPEHGFIIGVLCVMPRSGYFQGLEKMWKRFDRLDYYFPSFANLGEQEVKNYEVMNTGFEPDGTFGYQSRYAEYKASLDQVHGDFKGNLAFYHGARAFATPASAEDLPKLSESFTTPKSSAADDIDRIFPVLNSENPWFNADHFLLDIYNHLTVSRRMPKFVTPHSL